MIVVQGDEVVPTPAVRHRGGGLMSRILLEGRPGRPDNFQLSLGLTGRDFVSPRHRHNFEQYRCVLSGSYDFGRDGVMRAGMVGYFPEGVHYGPQSSADETLALVLQFGGASGGGYLSGEEVEAGRAALARSGVFRDGIYRRAPGTAGRRNQDAFEAIWEHVNGRPLVYPATVFEGPTLVDPLRIPWQRLSGAEAGRAEKRLGDFAANRTGMGMLRLDAASEAEVHGRAIYFVLEGAGAAGSAPLRTWTSLYLEAGERLRVRAEETVVALRFDLPEGVSGLGIAAG